MAFDAFVLLGQPRQLRLDPEQLKSSFLARAAEAHPDRVAGAGADGAREANEQFAALNAAYACLSEPKDRLRHLLELERGSSPREVQRIPSGTADLFAEIAQVCRAVDEFLEQQAALSSPVLRAIGFEQCLTWTDRLQGLETTVGQRQAALLDALAPLDKAWASAPPIGSPNRAAALPLAQAEEIYRALSYTTRWAGQLRERVVRLAGLVSLP